MANRVIHNKRPQRLVIALLDDEGKLVERALQPFEKTEPIPEDRIAPYTHRLAGLKKIRIRPATS